jgi:hypothetical protein
MGLGGEALSALGPPRMEDRSSGTGGHPVAETVVALAPPDFGLESSFHDKPQKKS